MRPFAPYLDSLGVQSQGMADLVTEWISIRSGSHDLEGLARMAEALKSAYSVLGAEMEELDLPPQRLIDSQGQPRDIPLGKALRYRKRPGAPLQVFLGIHYDVVYGTAPGVAPEIRLEDRVLHGSGGADAKGGLVILLKALETLEASPHAAGIGWEVLLNPDEELGSPGSLHLLKEAAGRNHLGLLFEPCLPDGGLVSVRKGSGNFTAVMRGKAAHAGRDPHLGRNAVSALAEFIVDLDRFGRSQSGIAVNVAQVEGGGALNRVPDLAIGRFNLRVRSADDQAETEAFMAKALAEFNRRDGFALEIHGGFLSPPKIPSGTALGLQRMVHDCGRDLGLDIRWEGSGGVSDGNKLAAAGLPNVDTLGARGGRIHSGEEYLDLDSLAERARLTALLLFNLATGAMPWPPPTPTAMAMAAAADAEAKAEKASRTSAKEAQAAKARAAAAAQAAADTARATASGDTTGASGSSDGTPDIKPRKHPGGGPRKRGIP